MKALSPCAPFCLLLMFAGSVHATTMYSFTLSETSVNSGTALEDISFSFTVPTFVTSGTPPVITPFTLTDGTNTSSPLSAVLFASPTDGFCMVFASASDVEVGATPVSCSAMALEPAGAYLSLSGSGALPSADDAYSLSGTGTFYFSAESFDSSNFSGTVTVSETAPEPGSVTLLGGGLAAMFLLARCRGCSKP